LKENLRKRQVEAPKVYLADSGLLHSPLGLETAADLEGHPKVGASWEGFMAGRSLGADRPQGLLRHRFSPSPRAIRPHLLRPRRERCVV
jgi:hypothetical protein